MKHLLYYSPGACSLAVHIVLEELGLPFSLQLTSTSDGTTRSPEYLRVNPKGRVPVLVSGDFVLTEAPAILMYLAATNPAAGLMPASRQGMARTVEWFNWLSGSVHAVAVRQVWRPETFTTDAAQHAAIVEKGRESLGSAFSLIEEKLLTSAWAVGSAYSVVDPYLLVFYRWGNRMGFDMTGRYPQWTLHTRLLIERLAVQRALARESISVWS
jgi:glutathione S-transferase